MRRWGWISLTIALFFVSASVRCQEPAAQTKPADASTAAAGALAEPEVLTLQQAITIALANNRQIKIFDQNALISNAKILAARTQRDSHFRADVPGSGLLTPVTIKFPKGAFGFEGTNPLPSGPTTV